MSTTKIIKQKRDKNPDTPEFTSKYYVTNGKMLPEVIKSQEQGSLTDELAKMLLTLTKRFAQRPCFSNYTYKEDMIAEAMVGLCKSALKFKPEKSSNPFAFYTTCINNSFLHFLNTEKKHRRTRDLMLVEIGENPSFNFQEESRGHDHYKDDFEDLKINIEEAKQRLAQDEIYAAQKLLSIAAEKERLDKLSLDNLENESINNELINNESKEVYIESKTSLLIFEN